MYTPCILHYIYLHVFQICASHNQRAKLKGLCKIGQYTLPFKNADPFTVSPWYAELASQNVGKNTVQDNNVRTWYIANSLFSWNLINCDVNTRKLQKY
jgi:hypothetical protein